MIGSDIMSKPGESTETVKELDKSIKHLLNLKQPLQLLSNLQK